MIFLLAFVGAMTIWYIWSPKLNMMNKTTIDLLRISAITAAIIWLITASCQAQEFDRILEKDIKTEINLNRITKSQSPLQLSSYYKAAADSLNTLLYNSYLQNHQADSRGERVDEERMWLPVNTEWDSKHSNDFSAFHIIIRNGDYKEALRKHLFDKETCIYQLEESQLSLSVIKHYNEIILTAVTF